MFSQIKWKENYMSSRLAAMVIGNAIMSFGSACFNLSNMGMHPFNSFNMALSGRIGIDFGTLQLIANLILLVLQWFWGRKFIGPGTVFNLVMVGYFIMFWSYLIRLIVPNYSAEGMRYLFLVVGVLFMSFGLSIYQSADMGIAPFDAMSLIMIGHFPIRYFWARLITDAIAALATFFAGGILGLGSILCVFCLGPFISFFNINFTDKVFPQFKEIRQKSV